LSAQNISNILTR